LRTERIRPFALSVSGVTSVAGVEAREIADIDGLGVGAERADRHRVARGEPRSLGMRIASGIWPPSKPARIMCEPARDFWPLIPRPE
jgi:hypothetical protein